MRPTFSAALLAGGRSSRMGRDKALLPLPGTSLLLWQHQLRTLESLKPQEIFWSGPPRPGIPPHVRIVPDEIAGAGPLAGLSACLQLMQADLLVVLAIDLPRMTAAFLQGLLFSCTSTQGSVAHNGTCYEPMAAVYSRRLGPLAREQLQAGRHSLQGLLGEAARQDSMRAVPVSADESALFQNWNSPADVS